MKRDKSGKNTTLTTQEFIESLPEGFTDRHNYSITEYKGCGQPIKFFCNVHGIQEQLPEKHKGFIRGCLSCNKDYYDEQRRLKYYIKFLEDAESTHGNNYDYSKVQYKKASQNVTITCPLHGDFEQTPNSHISSKSGCVECSKEKSSEKLRKSDTVLIKMSREKFGGKFEYDFSNYTSVNSIIIVKCPLHGNVPVKWSNHISSNHGCPRCCEEDSSPSHNRLSIEDNIERLKTNFGTHYHFFTEDIGRSGDKVRYYCSIHKRLYSTKLKHLRDGSGCKDCGKDSGKDKQSGFYCGTNIEKLKGLYLTEDNNLYFISLGESLYKIGIAKNVRSRINSIRHKTDYSPEVVSTWKSNTYDVYWEEQEILRSYKHLRYIPRKRFSGYTEILKLESSEVESIKMYIENLRNLNE